MTPHTIPFLTIIPRLHRLAGVAAALLSVVTYQPVGAQASGSVMSATHSSRAEIESLAVEADRIASSRDSSSEYRARRAQDATRLRDRLRTGDFQPGDRIVLSVRGDSALSDTFTVRAGRRLALPNIGDIVLDGVLRSELQEHLAREVSRFVREPVVTAHSLVRVAVLGEVVRPGFYAVAPDVLVSDAIMLAGGPAANADLQKTTIRRDAADFIRHEDVRKAVSAGSTLDELGIRAGDEIVVGRRTDRNWQGVAQTVGIVGGLIVSVYGATRIF